MLRILQTLQSPLLNYKIWFTTVEIIWKDKNCFQSIELRKSYNNNYFNIDILKARLSISILQKNDIVIALSIKKIMSYKQGAYAQTCSSDPRTLMYLLAGHYEILLVLPRRILTENSNTERS